MSVEQQANDGGASTTAVQSLLRTLDDAARWENRTASRVRAFARPSPRPLSMPGDGVAVHEEPGHRRRVI